MKAAAWTDYIISSREMTRVRARMRSRAPWPEGALNFPGSLRLAPSPRQATLAACPRCWSRLQHRYCPECRRDWG